MGFDMRWETRPEDEEVTVDAARDQFYAACKDRDAGSGTQAVVDKTYAELERADRSYFRLNVWGMGRYVHAMDVLGMLKRDDAGDWPPTPEDVDWDLYERATAADVEDGGALGVAARHKAAVEAHLVKHDESVPGIPFHKLYSTNDGWLVTPSEIVSALAVYDSTSKQERDAALADAEIVDTDYWRQWIGYLRLAIDHDGFRVR